MDDAELQEEEREVLLSIYEGDSAFKQLTPTTFQYKVCSFQKLRNIITIVFLNYKI